MPIETAQLVRPSWWTNYSTATNADISAVDRVSKERLYRATVTEAPDPGTANYKGYVYTSAGLLEDGVDNIDLPTNALYLKYSDGSTFTVEFGEDAKLSMVAEGENLSLYVYESAGYAERYQFNATTGNAVSDNPTEMSPLEISEVEATYKSDIDFDGKFGATILEQPQDRTGGLYKLSVLGQDIYAVGSKLEKAKGINASDYALMSSADQLWEPDQDFDQYKVVSRNESYDTGDTIDVVTGQDAEGNDIVEQQAVMGTRKRYDVYLSVDADTANDFGGETLRLTFDENRVLIADSEVYLDEAELSRDEAFVTRDLNGDSAIGLSVDAANPVDVDGGLYKGSILGTDFFVVGNLGSTDSTRTGTNVSGALLDSSDAAWEIFDGYSVKSVVDTSFEQGGETVSRRSILVVNDTDDTEVLRFDFDYEETELTDASGNAIGVFKVTDDSKNGLDQSPQDLAALERTFKRDLNADEIYGVSMDLNSIDEEGGLQYGTSLGTSFLMVSNKKVSNKSAPLDLSTALTFKANSDGTRDAWMPDDASTIAANNVALRNTVVLVENAYTDPDTAVETQYDVYVQEDSGVFARYRFNSDFELEEDRYELNDEELAAAEKSAGRDINVDASYGVVIDESTDQKAGLYAASFQDQAMFVRSQDRLRVGSEKASSAVDFSNVLQDALGVWSVAEYTGSGYTVTSALENDDGTYSVFAVSDSDPADVYHFTFNDQNVLVEDGNATHEEAMSLVDLAALESANRKDLNGDGIKGAALMQTWDKVSGLNQVESSGLEYFIVEPNRGDMDKLQNALFMNDQEDPWAPDESDPSVMIATTDPENGNTLVYVGVQPVDGNGDADYANYSYTRYEFDSTTGVYVDDSRTELSLTELTEEEVRTERDLNGDRSIGAKVVSKMDRTGGLYSAEIDGSTVYVFDPEGNRSVDLMATALFEEDGVTPWEGLDGYDLKSIVDNGDDTMTVYAVESATADEITNGTYDISQAGVKAFTFNEFRALSSTEDMVAVTIEGVEGLVEIEKTTGRDLNGDKTVGLQVTETLDRKGGLFQSNIMGESFYLIGQNMRSGRDADSAIDLTTALFDATGDNAWEPQAGYSIAGVVSNLDGSGDVESYSVFSYDPGTTAGEVDDVIETTWSVNADGTLTFSDQSSADPVRLIDLEKSERRDLSGDGVIGFRLNTAANTDVDRNYFGVSKATVYGDFSVFLAGENLKEGLRSNPLASGNALLAEDGSTPWAVQQGYQITGSEEVEVGGETKRYVYATLTSADTTKSEIIRYTFDKATGAQEGEFTGMSRHELATQEVSSRLDLNNDDSVGIGSISIVNDAASGKWTGLIKGSVAGDEYLMVKSDPRPNKGNLSSSLLNADGTAWAPAADFVIKGYHEVSSGGSNYIDIYGYTAATDADITRYRFESGATIGRDESWVVMAPTATLSATVGTRALGEAEVDASKDLNLDGTIGFKAVSDPSDVLGTQANGWTVSTANARQDGVTTGGDDDIYIVGRYLDRMGASASNTANAAALMVESGSYTNYWKPDEGFTVSQIWQQTSGGETTVNLYAQNSAGDKTLRYQFSQNTDDVWVMDSATKASVGMDPLELMFDEVDARRDFNTDGVVGLDIDETTSTGAGWPESLFAASVVGSDDTFLVVGSNLSDGTTSNPLGLDGLLTGNDGKSVWAAPDDWTVKSVVSDETSASVYVFKDGAAAGTFPTVLRYDFALNASNTLGEVFELTAESDAIDAAAAGTADVDDDTAAATVTLPAFIQAEVDNSRDLDGDGVVGLTVESYTYTDQGSASQNVAGLFKGSSYDTTDVLIASLTKQLSTGTKDSPTGFENALVYVDSTDADNPTVEFWDAGDDLVTAVRADSSNLVLYTIDSTYQTLTKYTLAAGTADDDTEDRFVIKPDSEDEAEKATLSGAAFINEEVDNVLDLNGDVVVGVDIVESTVSGALYKGQGLATTDGFETYYLAGYGLESGTVDRPLGLELALISEAAADADSEPTYWTPDDGTTISDFETADPTDGFSDSVLDVLRVDDDTTADPYVPTEPPTGATYAALLDTSGTASVVFFDADYTLIPE